MRLLPILTALLVAAAIFVFVFQRDALIGFASSLTADNTTAEDGDAPVDVSDTNPETPSETVKKLVSVVVMTSQSRTIDSAVLVRGETQAARQVRLLAETSGVVISTPLRKGSFVNEGQPMCELDPGTRAASLGEAKARLSEARARVPEAQARVSEAEARLEEALISDRAASKLSEGGFASETRVASANAATKAARAGVAAAESGLQSTGAGIESAEAGVAFAEKEIARLAIHASFDGILESDTAELGSLLQPGGLCAVVIQLDPIKLVGYVPETDINRVTMGAMAGAKLSNGHEVAGQVTFISRSADKLTRTFQVEVTVENKDLKIRDGQTVEMIIAAAGTGAHLLPGSSMTLNDAGGLGVRTIGADNIVKFVPITLIRDTVDGIWVSGLDDTANVIVVGQEFVVDGVQVIPTFREVSQ